MQQMKKTSDHAPKRKLQEIVKEYQPYQKVITIRQDVEGMLPYEIELPDAPDPKEFINYGLPKEEQYFVYEAKPDWLTKLNRMKRADAMKVAKTNAEINAWIASQWDKRKNGIFIYINGKPLHIPGKHWFYLNYYTIKGQIPDFLWVDLEYFYWYEFCILRDSTVYGGIELAKRRDGKSYRAACNMLEYISRQYEAFAGILSKNGGDAQELFGRGIVMAWRRLPFFFNPKFDNKTFPVKELAFRDASRGGEKLDLSDLLTASGDVDGLNSRIEARNTVNNAFDGEQLGAIDFMTRGLTLIMDEAGKWQEEKTVHIGRAWDKHKECLRVGTKKVGVAMLTTTIEEMASGGRGFVELWKQSDRSSKSRLGETESGLVPFFKKASECLVTDEYGFPIIGKPSERDSAYLKQKYLDEGEKVKVELGYHLMGGEEIWQAEYDACSSAKARQEYIRKYPPSIKKAFASVNNECQFDKEILDASKARFFYGDPCCEKFNLKNVGTEDEPKVEAEWCSNGKYKAPRKLIEHIQANYANQIYRGEDGFWRPRNIDKGLIGSDAFKSSKILAKEGSNGTLVTYFRRDYGLDPEGTPELDLMTDDYGIWYGDRPPSVDEYCREAIKLCVFLGMKVFPETNVDAVRNFFLANGMQYFLYHRKEQKYEQGQIVTKTAAVAGMQTIGGTRSDDMIAMMQSWVIRCGMRCKFEEIIDDCLKLEPNNWSPYDTFVGAVYALFGIQSDTKPHRSKDTQKKADVAGMLWEAR